MLLSNALAFMALIGSAAAVTIEKRAITTASTYNFGTLSAVIPACASIPGSATAPNLKFFDDTGAASGNTYLLSSEDSQNHHVEKIGLAIHTSSDCPAALTFTIGTCVGACTDSTFQPIKKKAVGSAAPADYAFVKTGDCYFAGATITEDVEIVPFDTKLMVAGSTTTKRFAVRVGAIAGANVATCDINVSSRMTSAVDFAAAPLTAIANQGTNNELIDFNYFSLKDYLLANRYFWNTVKVQFPISTSAATLPAISLTKSTTSTQFFSGIKYLIQKDGAACPATFTVAAKVGTTAIPEWSVATAVTETYAVLRGDAISGINYFNHEYVLMADDDYIDLKTEDFSLSISIPATTGVCDFYVHAVFNFEKPEVATTTTVATPIPTQGAGNQQQTTVAAAPSAATTAASTTTTAKPVGATNAAQGPAINVAAGMVAAVAAMLA